MTSEELVQEINLLNSLVGSLPLEIEWIELKDASGNRVWIK